MHPYFRNLHPAVVDVVRQSNLRYVIVGPGGWVGRATVEYLAALLGDAATERLLLLGSHARMLVTECGLALPVHSLAAAPDLEPGLPCFLLHYAFLTKDKVATLAPAEYLAQNLLIRQQVGALVARLQVQGLAVASSGAVYDFIAPCRPQEPAAVVYGRLKYEDEFYFAGMAQALGARLVCPRIFNLSGPYINKLNTYALASFIQNALQGHDIEIQAPHPVVRAYAPVQQLIELQILLLHASTTRECCFDYAGQEPIALTELAQHIATVQGVGVKQAVSATPAAVDVYLGDPLPLAQLLRSWGLETMSLAEQIQATTTYIEAKLRQ